MPESSIYDYLAKDHDDATERQVLELFQASLLNAPIAVAMVELGIPGVLGDKALTGEEVAAAAGTDPDATGRLLRAGVAVGLATVDAGGRFTLTELGRRIGAGPGSVADMAGFWLAPTRDALGGLAEHVRSGRRVDPAAPGGMWDYFGSHPADTVKFSRAMGYVTSRLLAAMTAAGYRPPPRPAHRRRGREPRDRAGLVPGGGARSRGRAVRPAGITGGGPCLPGLRGGRGSHGACPGELPGRGPGG